MTTEANNKSSQKKTTFVCKYCNKKTPLNDMVVVTEYFPAIVICRDCSINVRK